MNAVASQWVTRAEFARMRGVSRKTVTKWVESGRITLSVIDGREVIDPTQAAIQLKSTSQRAQEEADILADDDVEPDDLPIASAPSLTQLKARTEEERSALLKMQRLERERSLINRERVELEQETAARLVRQALDAVPSKAEDIYAAAQAGGVIAVRKALKGLMRELQEGLSSAMIAAADQIEAQRYAEEDDAAV